MNGTEQRRNRAARLPAVLAAVAAVGTVFVAATAFVLAYGGSKGAALDAGISPAAAGWYPLCIEGALVVASVSTVILRGRDRAAAWLVLLLFVAVSTAANVLHSLDHGAGHWWSPYAAAVPPLSLPICTWLAERVALSTVHQPPISAGPAIPPGRAGGPHVDTATGPASTPPLADTLPAAVDGVRADAPDGVRPDTPEPSAGHSPDDEPDASGSTGPDVRPDVVPDVRADTESGDRPDADRTRRTPPRRTRPGRPAKARPGRPAGHSPDRTFPDWRTSDWSAVAQAREISRTRAYEVIAADPTAPQAARQQLAAASAPLNGHAP